MYWLKHKLLLCNKCISHVTSHGWFHISGNRSPNHKIVKNCWIYTVFHVWRNSIIVVFWVGGGFGGRGWQVMWSLTITQLWINYGRFQRMLDLNSGADPGFQVRAAVLKITANFFGVFRAKNHDLHKTRGSHEPVSLTWYN